VNPVKAVNRASVARVWRYRNLIITITILFGGSESVTNEPCHFPNLAGANVVRFVSFQSPYIGPPGYRCDERVKESTRGMVCLEQLEIFAMKRLDATVV